MPRRQWLGFSNVKSGTDTAFCGVDEQSIGVHCCPATHVDEEGAIAHPGQEAIVDQGTSAGCEG